jgi:hypothetical protein
MDSDNSSARRATQAILDIIYDARTDFLSGNYADTAVTARMIEAEVQLSINESVADALRETQPED